MDTVFFGLRGADIILYGITMMCILAGATIAYAIINEIRCEIRAKYERKIEKEENERTLNWRRRQRKDLLINLTTSSLCNKFFIREVTSEETFTLSFLPKNLGKNFPVMRISMTIDPGLIWIECGRDRYDFRRNEINEAVEMARVWFETAAA